MRRWDASGKIRCSRSVGNHRRISILEIERILHGDGKARNRGVAIYGRVSSHDQK
ncbi:MAG: IS607 family transposase, partial [Promethearchaeota archaeon]